MENNTIHNADCFDLFPEIEDESVDLILTDPPFGTTAADWDTVLPMNDYVFIEHKNKKKKRLNWQEYMLVSYEKGKSYKEAKEFFDTHKVPGLWTHYNRIVKPKGAIVIFGSEPFSTQVRASNPDMYKYDWIWKKSTVDGFFNAKCRPLKTIENIMVFSKAEARAKGDNMIYYPQGVVEVNKVCKEGRREGDTDGHKYYRGSLAQKNYTQQYTNYPTEILLYPRDAPRLHPTQKPVELLQYLIKTYTDDSGLVLDNCMGSGSTIVAAIKTDRRYIGIEKDPKIFRAAEYRIKEALAT